SSRLNRKCTTKWIKNDITNGVHLEFFFIDNLSSSTSNTLFPYTTLFRSLLPEISSQVVAAVPNGLIVEYVPWAWKLFHAHGTYSDRKSTRLNSSHVAISYAVFCLKKKKRVVENVIILQN